MKKILKITCTECNQIIFDVDEKEREFSESEFAVIIDSHKSVRHTSKIKLEYESKPLPKQAQDESKTEVSSKKQTQTESKKDSKKEISKNLGVEPESIELPTN